MGEGHKFGYTNTPLYVYGNINKVIGLWDILKKKIDTYPPNSTCDIIIPMFQFIAIITFNIGEKDVSMFLIDTNNDEDKALEFYNTLLTKKAPPSLGNEFMKAFHDLRSVLEEFKDRAELSLPKK